MPLISDNKHLSLYGLTLTTLIEFYYRFRQQRSSHTKNIYAAELSIHAKNVRIPANRSALLKQHCKLASCPAHFYIFRVLQIHSLTSISLVMVAFVVLNIINQDNSI